MRTHLDIGIPERQRLRGNSGRRLSVVGGQMNNGKIKVESNGNKVFILADADGLKYLADVCLRIIGKNDPSGHFYLMEQMGNLETGSAELEIAFSEDL
jgi:hypothetical protein